MDTMIEIWRLKKLFQDAAEIGGQKSLIPIGEMPLYINRSKAYKLYGRSNIDRWIKEGLLKVTKKGSASSSLSLLDRIELESVAKESNRHTYLSVAERQKTVTKD